MLFLLLAGVFSAPLQPPPLVRIPAFSDLTLTLRAKVKASRLSIPNQLRAVSVTVLVVKDGRTHGAGSGTVIIGADGTPWVLTAGHVVADKSAAGHVATVQVTQLWYGKDRKPHTRRFFRVPVVYYSPPGKNGSDLTLLRLDEGEWTGPGAKVYAGDEPPELDTPIIHCGSYLAKHMHTISRGEIRATDYLSSIGQKLDHADCHSFPGSSGGGMFTADGRLLGVLTRGSGESISLYVPIRQIRAWAKKIGRGDLFRGE